MYVYIKLQAIWKHSIMKHWAAPAWCTGHKMTRNSMTYCRKSLNCSIYILKDLRRDETKGYFFLPISSWHERWGRKEGKFAPLSFTTRSAGLAFICSKWVWFWNAIVETLETFIGGVNAANMKKLWIWWQINPNKNSFHAINMCYLSYERYFSSSLSNTIHSSMTVCMISNVMTC